MPVHQEANEARRAGANQERIGKGDVIAHQQRRPAPGQVFRAAHLNAIERVGQQEEAQADHEVGQDGQDMPRGAKRNHRHDQQNLVRLHSAGAGEECENARAQKHSGKGQTLEVAMIRPLECSPACACK